MIPYAQPTLTAADKKAVRAVLDGRWLTQGPIVKRLEDVVRERIGTTHAVAVSSGTAALHLAYLGAGMEQHNLVGVTANTFVATPNTVRHTGADPIFLDINPSTGLVHQIDEGYLDWYVPVHFAGNRATVDTKLPMVEDACHALGADFPMAKDTIAACFSLHAIKTIAAGEGGVVCTNEWAVASVAASMRDHGRVGKVFERGNSNSGAGMVRDGYNYRLTEIGAALALSQMERLDEIIARRRTLVEQYNVAFLDKVRVMPHQLGSAALLYVIIVDPGRRDEIRKALLKDDIETQIVYRSCLAQPFYENWQDDLPHARTWGDSTIALPLHNSLTDEQQQQVITSVLNHK